MKNRQVTETIDGAFLITFLTGLFYVAGQAFFSGMLSFYGIHASVLDISFSDAVHLGFFAIAGTILKVAYWTMVGTAALSIAIWTIHFAGKRVKLDKIKLSQHLPDWEPTQFGPIAGFLDKLHSIISAWGILAFIAMSIIFFADRKLSEVGKEAARIYYNSVISGKAANQELRINIQGTLATIAVIHCSPELCAAIIRENKKIVLLKRNLLSEASKALTSIALPPKPSSKKQDK